MAIGEIKQCRGSPNMGLPKYTSSSKGKDYEIEYLVSYLDTTVASRSRNIGLRIHCQNGDDVVLSLSTNAALELVKGILENTADVCIHCDEELQKIMNGAVQRSEADAKAVVDAILRSVGGSNAQSP